MARTDGKDRDEEVRGYKNAGLSEREAVLKSLKRTKADKKRQKKAMTVGPYSGEDYPYGTRLDLDEDSLKKLGIKELPEAGDELCVTAHATVTRSEESTSSDGRGSKTRRYLCLQITKMALTEEPDED